MTPPGPRLMDLTPDGDAIPTSDGSLLPACPTCAGEGLLPTQRAPQPIGESDRWLPLCLVCQGSGLLFGEEAWLRQQSMDADCLAACPDCSPGGTRDGRCSACGGTGLIVDYGLAGL